MFPVWIIGVSVSLLACVFSGINIICLSLVITSKNLSLVGFAQSLIQLSIIQPFIVPRQCRYWGNPGERRSFVLCVIFEGAYQTMNLASLAFVSASDSCAIVMSYPVIVSLISHFFNSSIKFQKRYLVTGVLTLCGTFLVTKPDFLFRPNALDGSDSNKYYGYALAGSSALLNVAVTMASERLKTTSHLTTTSASSIIPVVVYGVYAFATGNFGDYPSCGTRRAICVVLSSVFNQISLSLFFLSFQYTAEARVLSVVGAMKLPLVFLADVFILGNHVTIFSVGGMILIFVSLIGIAFFRSGLLDASKSEVEQINSLVYTKTDSDLIYARDIGNDLVHAIESLD